MPFEVKVPSLGESVTEAYIARWLKKNGERVKKDEPIVELETDKANAELRAERAGTLEIVRAEGAVKVGDVLARIQGGPGDDEAPPRDREAIALERPSPRQEKAAEKPAAPLPEKTLEKVPEKPEPRAKPAPAAATAAAPPPLSPTMRKRLREQGGGPSEVVRAPLSPAAPALAPAPGAAPEPAPPPSAAERNGEHRTPMTRLRKRIAERLLEAQRSAAILTTFNEIDMSAVMEMRARLKEPFQEKHGVSLGFLSFFARACVLALRDVPIVNASIDGDDIIMRDHVHLGIAVSTDRGLVVPVVRHAERLSFAEIERAIARLAGLAREGKLAPDDLAGGTFTITNGGVFGSLLSTPILNPPQSGILGMHKIEDRPVATREKQVVVRPMMYVALSYDHRLIDGRDSVTFLVKVKERIEDPARLLLEV